MIRNGSRPKRGDELIDYKVYQLRHKGNPMQVCWDYTEITDQETDQVDFHFKYVNVADLKINTLQAAGVPQEIIDQIDEVISDPELTDSEALQIILGQ